MDYLKHLKRREDPEKYRRINGLSHRFIEEYSFRWCLQFFHLLSHLASPNGERMPPSL
jgi:hypothetical protein